MFKKKKNKSVMASSSGRTHADNDALPASIAPEAPNEQDANHDSSIYTESSAPVDVQSSNDIILDARDGEHEANRGVAAQPVETVPPPPTRPVPGAIPSIGDTVVTTVVPFFRRPNSTPPREQRQQFQRVMLTKEAFNSMEQSWGVGGKLAWQKMQDCRKYCFDHSLWEVDLTESNEFPWQYVLRALQPAVGLSLIGPGIVSFKFRLLSETDHNYIKKDSGERHVFEITWVDGSRWRLHYHKSGRMDSKRKEFVPAKNDACHLTTPGILCLLCYKLLFVRLAYCH